MFAGSNTTARFSSFGRRTPRRSPQRRRLIQGRFLRKKFKDPITNDDFDFVGVSAGQPNAPGVQAPNMPGAPQQCSPGVQQRRAGLDS
jgi:hypothetical protein